MTTTKQARNSHFQRGTAVYTCRCCNRNTRSTGRGDNEHVNLCAECYDLAGEENHVSDTGGEFYDSPENVLSMIAAVAAKGDASCWNELKAKAEAAIAAKAAPIELHKHEATTGDAACLLAAAPAAPKALSAEDYHTVEAQADALYRPAVKFIGSIQSKTNRKLFADILEGARENANDTVYAERAAAPAEWGTVFKGTIQQQLDFLNVPGTVAQLNLTRKHLTAYFAKLGLI